MTKENKHYFKRRHQKVLGYEEDQESRRRHSQPTTCSKPSSKRAGNKTRYKSIQEICEELSANHVIAGTPNGDFRANILLALLHYLKGTASDEMNQGLEKCKAELSVAESSHHRGAIQVSCVLSHTTTIPALPELITNRNGLKRKRMISIVEKSKRRTKASVLREKKVTDEHSVAASVSGSFTC